MIEDDHAVGDVFFQAVARERTVSAFARNDGSHPLILQPPEETAKLSPQDCRIRQAGKENLDRVDDDALGPDGVNRMSEADEESFQIVFAGLLDLAALDMDMVDEDLLGSGKAVQVKAEGGHILGQFLGRFLKGDKYAGLIEVFRPAHKELHAEQRLSRACPAADQGGASFRQSAVRNFIEAFDSRGGFLKFGTERFSSLFRLGHVNSPF